MKEEDINYLPITRILQKYRNLIFLTFITFLDKRVVIENSINFFLLNVD